LQPVVVARRGDFVEFYELLFKVVNDVLVIGLLCVLHAVELAEDVHQNFCVTKAYLFCECRQLKKGDLSLVAMHVECRVVPW